MFRFLTLFPIVIASVLISCGPGVSGGDNSSVGPYAGEVIGTEGLVFYARMDESQGSISDFYGRAIGRDSGIFSYGLMGGMINNGNGPDQPNSAINFSANGCFYFGEVDALSLQPPFTIMMMVNTVPQGGETVIGKWGVSGNHSWRLTINAGPSVEFRYSTDGIDDLTPVSIGVSPSSTWYHIAFVVGADGFIDLYSNGNGFSFNNGPLAGIFSGSSAAITVGCDDNFGGFGNENNFSTGIYDEIAVFNRELSADEIFRINQARFN